MIAPTFKLSETELETAKRATKARVQSKRIQSRGTNLLSDRVSTFPKSFEILRDRILERAKSTPAFLDTVFTLHATPTDDEIIHSVENRLFSLVREYPAWFGSTPHADDKARALRHDHDVSRGLIQAAPLTDAQRAAITRRKQERVEREERITARASTTMDC